VPARNVRFSRTVLHEVGEFVSDLYSLFDFTHVTYL
jgi:hypothetical protein